jgi:hypothetical protein
MSETLALTGRLVVAEDHEQLRRRQRAGIDSVREGGSHFQCPSVSRPQRSKVRDGFGDVAFLVKYRLLSANEEHGSYILTAFLGWSLPTGDHKNGAAHAVITPTIAYGKGFGNFDL